MLLGHGADVAPDLGAVVEGGRRCRPAIALPHLPDDGAALAHRSAAGAAGRDVYRRLGDPDGPHPHHGWDDGRRRLRAASKFAHRLWRERRRLDTLCAAPHGFRVRGPVPRPDEIEAERILAPAMPRDVP